MTAQLDRMARAIRINTSSDDIERERLTRWWDAGECATDVRDTCYRQAQAALDAMPEPDLEPREDGLVLAGVGHVRCPCGVEAPLHVYAGLSDPDDDGVVHVLLDSDTTELWAHYLRHDTEETD